MIMLKEKNEFREIDKKLKSILNKGRINQKDRAKLYETLFSSDLTLINKRKVINGLIPKKSGLPEIDLKFISIKLPAIIDNRKGRKNRANKLFNRAYSINNYNPRTHKRNDFKEKIQYSATGSIEEGLERSQECIKKQEEKRQTQADRHILYLVAQQNNDKVEQWRKKEERLERILNKYDLAVSKVLKNLLLQ